MKFELVTPDRGISADTNWSLCFISQEEKSTELNKPYLKEGKASYYTPSQMMHFYFLCQLRTS